MKNFDIQVGDRITFIYKNEKKVELAGSSQLINQVKKAVEILKIERIGSNGWYTVYEKEEKKELLTEEEREFLSCMCIYYDIEFIIFNSEGMNIYGKHENRFVSIYSPKNLKFNNVERYKEYSLSELGLEE